MRHDLLERRVGGQEAFEQAREVRIRAGELGRRRRTVCLGVAGVERQAGLDQIRAADHRVEALEGVVAVELRRVAGVVGDLHAGEVIAAADRQREVARQVDRVGEVDAVVVVERRQIARRNLVGLNEENPEAVDDELGCERAERGRGTVADVAVIVAGADQELVLVAGDVVLVHGLPGEAEAVGELRGLIERAERVGDVRRDRAVDVHARTDAEELLIRIAFKAEHVEWSPGRIPPPRRCCRRRATA